MSKKINVSMNMVADETLDKAIACDLNKKEDGDLEQILKDQENAGQSSKENS